MIRHFCAADSTDRKDFSSPRRHDAKREIDRACSAIRAAAWGRLKPVASISAKPLNLTAAGSGANLLRNAGRER